jgi:hypothetical protein
VALRHSTAPFAFPGEKTWAAAQEEKKTMNTKFKIGAVLIALALCALPAAAFSHSILLTLTGLSLVAGVTVTYASFQDGSGPHQAFTGGTTAPTITQSQTVQAVVVTINMADADTTAVITHNMQNSAAQLAALQPYIQWYLSAMVAGATAAPLLTFALTSGNVVTVTKAAASSSGGTFIVIVRRPYSASQ